MDNICATDQSRCPMHLRKKHVERDTGLAKVLSLSFVMVYNLELCFCCIERMLASQNPLSLTDRPHQLFADAPPTLAPPLNMMTNPPPMAAPPLMS